MSSLVAATRPTRRDLAHHPLRVLAAVLLVALPVVLFSVVSVWFESNNSALRLAEPRTIAWYSGGECVQALDAGQAHCTHQDEISGVSEQEQLQAVLPEGFTTHLQVSETGGIITESVSGSAQILQVPTTALPPELDPGTGSLPGPGEIMLPTSTAERLGVAVGDQIELEINGPARQPLRVSGVLPGFVALTTEPTLMEPADYRSSGGVGSLGSGWMITGPDAFTWEDVETLNAAGFLVHAQDVLDDPPPVEELDPAYRSSTGEAVHDIQLSTWLSIISTGATVLIGVVLLLLLISPVFTIAVSRQSRVFALMSSQGATPRQIRWAVLTYGLVTGLIGATLGLVLGVGGTSLWWMVQNPGWPVTIPWSLLVVAWVCAVLGSVFAAFFPAVLAARAAISAGIQGATQDRMRGWRPWMAIGPVILVIVTVAWFLARRLLGDGTLLVDLEPVLMLLFLLALAATAPALVWGLGRITHSAPLALRLAGRNAGRQSLRSVPVVAALVALVFLPVTVSASLQAEDARTEFLNTSVYQPGALSVSPSFETTGNLNREDLAPTVDLVRSLVGPAESIDLYGVPFGRGPGPRTDLHRVGDEYCEYDDEADTLLAPEGADPRTDPAAAAECLPERRRDHVDGALSGVARQALIAGPEILDLLSGMDEAERTAAAEALEGSAVLTGASEPAGEAEFQRREVEGDLEEPVVVESAVLPVRPVLPERFPGLVLSPQAAQDLGFQPVYLGTALLPDTVPDYATQQEILTGLGEQSYGVEASFTVTHRAPGWFHPAAAGVLGLIVLVVVTLALALSAPQSRRQFALLDALGADPSLAPRTTAVLAGLLAAVATTAGAGAAYLVAWLGASRTITDINGAVLDLGKADFVRPDWGIVLVLVVATPLLTAAVGGLFHRRRGELEYRET